MCHPDAPANPGPAAPVEEEVEVPVPGGERMPALLARPERGGPGVLVIADVYGRSPFYEALAGRLAAAGFTALLPEYFFRLGPLAERTRDAAFARRRGLDDHQTLGDLGAALDWLRARPEAGGDRLGVVGFCMGGTYVLNLAAERDDLAAVCYYGFPQRRPLSGRPGPAPLDQVDRIRGPLLGFWGDQDEGVGMENVSQLAAGLAARGVDFEHTVYPGLGHGFLAQALDQPDDPAHGPAAESWERAVAFYRRHLEAPAEVPSGAPADGSSQAPAEPSSQPPNQG